MDEYYPGKYSRALFEHSMRRWDYYNGPLPSDWVDTLWRYYAMGLSPGSFFSAVLANNMSDAMANCHPGNRVDSIRALCGWIRERGMHGIAWGDYDTVRSWLRLPQSMRVQHLAGNGLAYPSEAEVCLILEDASVPLPI